MTYKVVALDTDFHEFVTIGEGLSLKEAEDMKKKYGHGVMVEPEPGTEAESNNQQTGGVVVNRPWQYADLRLVEHVERVVQRYQGERVARRTLRMLLSELGCKCEPMVGPDKHTIKVETVLGNFFIHNKDGVITFSESDKYIESVQSLSQIQQFLEDFVTEHVQ